MHKIKPIGIGYWESKSDVGFPDPKDFVDGRILRCDRNKLIEYLKKGKKFITYIGFSSCRFCCGISDFDMGSSCLTDGTYVWPEGLVHYIDRHDVWLPDEFVEHANLNYSYLPEMIELSRLEMFSLDWWVRQKQVK